MNNLKIVGLFSIGLALLVIVGMILPQLISATDDFLVLGGFGIVAGLVLAAVLTINSVLRKGSDRRK